MKALTKLVTASLLALSAIAPALAAEEDTLLERNTYNSAVVHHVSHNAAQAHRAVDAFASASTGAANQTGPDFSIDSQR